nr:P-loop NTPase fold protein [Pedobacter panaciterrae]
MNTKRSPDNPVHLEVEDKFQRFHFSKRIADTIRERESEECIVLGIYGAWGEGKTSVLNFIQSGLNQETEMITLNFNPWRYPDENTLLQQFFTKLANALDTNLKTTTEKIGATLSKYAKLVNVPFVADLSGQMEAIGDAFGAVEVETLKDRISQAIRDSGKKLVIFIDDIDRLDKTEIHSIFRLVKLTADFANTTYLLFFDEEMVSAAIGGRFGAGDQLAGKQFLEKIIQVPLRIPLAQPAALQAFFIEEINAVLDRNGIKVNENETTRFFAAFEKAILGRLDTPRMAIRYANTLSFSIPMLMGEVDIVDLMLIEALKIFYPQHYEFVKNEPSFFIQTYYGFEHSRNDKKITWLKETLDDLGKHLTVREIDGLKVLLTTIFPRLEEAFNNIRHRDNVENEWYRQKLIAAPVYFERYFSYAVIKGDLSDVVFEDFVGKFATATEKTQKLKTLIELSSSETLIKKLRSREELLPWEFASPLAETIAENIDLFESNGAVGFFSWLDPFSQSAILISRLIAIHENRTEGYELLKKIVELNLDTKYSFELIRWVKASGKEDKALFTSAQMTDLKVIILAKCLGHAKDQYLHDIYPDLVYRLYNIWKDKDEEAFNAYIKSFLEAANDNYLKLLYSLTSKLTLGSSPNSYTRNIDQEQFKYITGVVDKELIKDYISLNYTDEELSGEINWEELSGPYQTDQNLVRQFMHWYQHKGTVDEVEVIK